MKTKISLILCILLCLFILPQSVSAATEGDFIYEVSDGVATIVGLSSNFSGKLIIPSTLGGYPVTEIGESAFENNRKITEVVIEEGITTIGAFAFDSCPNLESITLPDSITTIWGWAFSGRTVNVHVSSLKEALEIDYSSADTRPNYFYINNVKTPLPTGDVVIPEGTTRIGRNVFLDCTEITSVTLPGSVTTIGSSAFSGCTGLTDIKGENNVTSIDNFAFKNCKSLTSFTLGNKLQSIGSEVFSGCSKLADITFGNSIKSIGYNSFYGCTELKSVYIPTLKQWFELDYEGTNSDPLFNGADLYIGNVKTDMFTGDIIVPDDVTHIGSFKFNCKNITSVTIPDSVQSIGKYAFSGCTKLKKAIVGDNVTSISEHAFADCTGLAEVQLGNNVSSIDTWAFYGCLKLSKINIPQSVTSIGTAAFYNCIKLPDITLPDNLTFIGEHAFQGCTAIGSVYITSLKSWYELDFESGYSNPIHYGATLYVNNQITYVRDGEIVIPEGITHIGSNKFRHAGITSIVIPTSVVSIGDNAFYNCIELKDVYYGGTEKDWNKIVIGINNEYLTNATVHYNYIPMAVSTVSDYTKNGNIVNFNLNLKRPEDVAGTVIAAVYDENGAMVGLKVLPAKAITPVSIDATDGSYIKALWWDASGTKPYTDNIQLNIN